MTRVTVSLRLRTAATTIFNQMSLAEIKTAIKHLSFERARRAGRVVCTVGRMTKVGRSDEARHCQRQAPGSVLHEKSKKTSGPDASRKCRDVSHRRFLERVQQAACSRPMSRARKNFNSGCVSLVPHPSMRSSSRLSEMSGHCELGITIALLARRTAIVVWFWIGAR